MEKKYAIYITGTSSRLNKILDKCTEKQLSLIKFVFSDELPPIELVEKIKSKGISFIYFPYSQSGKSVQEKRVAFSDSLLRNLLDYGIDYCFSFGGHIISGEILSVYENRIINFHPAILPMYPGCKAIDQAVSHGNTLLVGNTAHFVDSGTDTGPIIMQSVTCLKNFTDTKDYDVVLDLQLGMFFKLMDLFNDDRVNVSGDTVIIDGADYSVSHCYPLV